MKILAIGATGFIGSYVVRNLSGKGHELAVLSRRKNKTQKNKIGLLINGDGYRLSESIKEIRAFGPEVVLDFILYTEKQATDFVEICRGLAKRTVVISSADVYRNYDGLRGSSSAQPDAVPLGEDSPLRESLFPYRGADTGFEWADEYEKILVEKVLMNEKEPASTVLRLPAVYGPGDRQHRVGEYLSMMDGGSSEIVIPRSQAKWRWTRGYVENVAAAIVAAVEDSRAENRIFNVGDQKALCEKEWIEEIGKAAGWNGKVIVDLNENRDGPDYSYHLETDCSWIRLELGLLEPVSIKKGLKKTIDWERAK